MSAHPVIAVIGHPNEGKSSVLSTLTEDDSVVVSDYPGETVACQRFPLEINGETLLEFVDTPGFQNPTRLLDWMRQSGLTDQALLAEVQQQFGGDPDYHHDLELMRPLREGAGLIYVVDCSRPLLEVDLAEMEILRLINRPRMAVINFKDADRSYLKDWKEAFRRHFNVIREFNAHQARFPERLALFETLKAIQQDWEPALNRAIDTFQQDWDYRRNRVVDAIVRYLSWALRYQAERKYAHEADRPRVEEELMQQYRDRIAKEEGKLFDEIRRHYRHHLYQFELPAQSILQEDLFSKQTWQVLGLTDKQLMLAAAATGAGAGAALDLALAGLSFGIFTATGAALGGGGAFFKGKELSKVRFQRLPMGGFSMTAGPSKNPQFPFILLDRVLVYYSEIANHAHGKRIEANGTVHSNSRSITFSFSKNEIHELSNAFSRIGSKGTIDREHLQQKIADILNQNM